MTTPTLETIAAQAGVTPVGGDDGEIEYLTHCERGSFTVTVTNKPGVVKFFLYGSPFSGPGLPRVFYLPVLGQLPKPTVTVAIQLELDFGPLGDTEISLSGPKSDYQALEDKLLAFANTAQEADGAMTITVAWDEPIAVDGAEWNQLHKLVQNADPGEITVTAEVLR